MSRRSAAPYEIEGRTVFITGAARGIGAATAERLHARGANVARLGDRAMAFEADVTDYEALERAVKGTVERFGALDVAIANAGLAFTGTLASAPIEQVERTLAVNFLGVWRTDRAVIAQIRERKGYLLNIASVAAITRAPLMGPYTASKAGVEGLSDCLRMETHPSGARVGCAYFGFLDTDLVRAAFAEAPTQRLNSRLPGFIRNPAPLTKAIDAIERGIERRSARVWAPRWVGPFLPLRGLLQPLTERQILANPETLAEGLGWAEAAADQSAAEDPLLGIAAKAL
jgi:NAD(P)-dependent dehydrogenase (short-subunit alcohol dehydrogenase family)